MRISRLLLERYGRFENCALDFCAATPDLHVIYGANEAGKTTALAGICDLLFGFQPRSPYNFRFDYPLLRVGAELQEGGIVLACRRRKANTGSLVDERDKPINEGPLLAMLHGQNRETFRLSFGLDQDTLRRGGEAMLDASNDAGRALFAAGSGLTGISALLDDIEEEADGIWGVRSKAARTYTKAESDLKESLAAIKDKGLKAKAWTNARKALEKTGADLEDLKAKLSAVIAESRKVERVRRIASHVRLRASLIRQIEEGAGAPDIAVHNETAAEAAMNEAEEAARAGEAAERLCEDAARRMTEHQADPAILAEANAIENLIRDYGAVAKVGSDLKRIEEERTALGDDIENLRADAGIGAEAPLSQANVARLRHLAGEYAAGAASLREIESNEETLRERLKSPSGASATPMPDGEFTALAEAVDEARGLGADMDERCARARSSATAAAREAEAALGRLSPWSGNIEALASLAVPGSGEIDAAKSALTLQRDAVARAKEETRRIKEEVERLGLEIAGLPRGSVVSADELAASRQSRSESWMPLRGYILDHEPLEDAARATEEFEAGVEAADELADRRFSLAAASTRLLALEADKARCELHLAQAQRRGEATAEALSRMEDEWAEGLAAAGLPALEPVRLEGWLSRRIEALDALKECARIEEEAARDEARRDRALEALLALPGLPSGPGTSPETLAAALAQAERKRTQAELVKSEVASARRETKRTEDDLASQAGRKSVVVDAMTKHIEAWKDALSQSGLQLDIAGAETRLAVMDVLRQKIDEARGLDRRIAGMKRDTAEFSERLKALAERLGLDETEPGLLNDLHKRLSAARAAEILLEEIGREEARREGEAKAAAAKRAAALEALRPVLEMTGTKDMTELSRAIERSRALREARLSLAGCEKTILAEGEGYQLDELVADVAATDPDTLSARSADLQRDIDALNVSISAAAQAHGEAQRSFTDMEALAPGAAAAAAASDAEQAKAEMAAQAEAYILKRAQALMLKKVIETYRMRHQDPLLARAGEIFRTLTLGRYGSLDVALDGASPRLVGIRHDGKSAIGIEAMSEGTTDQLFLALRLASVEQSADAGIRLPFLADDLFVNFDDERAEAGFRVLGELAGRTQVLFFTHHRHLADIARNVFGPNGYSESKLG